MQLAEDMGMAVERRQIPEEELATFEEAGACGTAAVISPIERIDDWRTRRAILSAKTASRDRFVHSYITTCVISSTASNPMCTDGLRW